MRCLTTSHFVSTHLLFPAFKIPAKIFVTVVASTVSIDCKYIVSRIKIVSARDAFHEVVKTALQKDSWLITHDPYPLQAGIFDLFVTPFIQGLVEQNNLLLLIYDIDGEVIEQWLPLMNTNNISKTC